MTITYNWGGDVANRELNMLHAEACETRVFNEIEWSAHGLYRLSGARIAECWVLPENQYEFDRIWG
jgi:hypothetical protein